MTPVIRVIIFVMELLIGDIMGVWHSKCHVCFIHCCLNSFSPMQLQCVCDLGQHSDTAKTLEFHRTEGGFWPDFVDFKHYTQEFYRSYSVFTGKCPRTGKFHGVWTFVVVICYMMAPSHYLNQSQPIFSTVLIYYVRKCSWYQSYKNRKIHF